VLNLPDNPLPNLLIAHPAYLLASLPTSPAVSQVASQRANHLWSQHTSPLESLPVSQPPYLVDNQLFNLQGSQPKLL
jgi:hypothetical protein